MVCDVDGFASIAESKEFCENCFIKIKNLLKIMEITWRIYMTYYKISEEELLELIKDRLKLYILEIDGVDNWEWYMEGKQDFMIEQFGENLSFEEAAQIDLKKCFADKEIIK